MSSAVEEKEQSENGAKQSSQQTPCVCNNGFGSRAINTLGRIPFGVVTTASNGIKTAKDRGTGLYGATVRTVGRGASFASNKLMKESERVENLKKNPKK